MKKFESYQESFFKLKEQYEDSLKTLAQFVINNPKLATVVEFDYEAGVVALKIYYAETMHPNDG